MSEVKLNMAYTTIRKMESELASLREDNNSLSERFDQVCAVRDALREELAEWKARAGRRTAERTEFMSQRDDTQQRLAAAEQRNAELTQALERGKLWLELFRAWFGDYGVSQEDHAAIIRTLKGLPHPPSEFDQPTESGGSE